MNAGRDVERLIADWFVEEAVLRAPDRVLEGAGRVVDRTKQRRLGVAWRIPRMSAPFRLAAAAVLGVLVIGGALILARPGTTNIGEPSPTAEASAAPATPVGDLTTTFDSARYGYTIRHPADWTATQATKSWEPGTVTNWGDPALDVLQGPKGRLVAASQALAADQSLDDWYIAYCSGGIQPLADCADYATEWSSQLIDDQIAYVDLDGPLALAGSINAGSPMFDAVVIAYGRAYEFTLDGEVTRADFDRLLSTVSFGRKAPFSLDGLTAEFTSPLYGYTINTDPTWTVSAAETPRTDPLSEETFSDLIRVVGTDSRIAGSAAPLGEQTWDEFLAKIHVDALGNLPSGCDGGDPTTWPTTTVGGHAGRLQQLCNAAIVYVLVDGNVYEFDFGSDTFATSLHFEQADFTEVLTTVRFPDS